MKRHSNFHILKKKLVDSENAPLECTTRQSNQKHGLRETPRALGMASGEREKVLHRIYLKKMQQKNNCKNTCILHMNG